MPYEVAGISFGPSPMLFAHDLRRPIGAWREWSDGPDGLHVKGNITLGTRDGQEAYALAKDGALSGLSLGWNPIRHARDTKGIRQVAEADILEGSLVPVPMNDRTRVLSVKSIDGARDIEDLLQQAGMSGRKAKCAASAAWKSINDQSDEAAADADLAALILASTARLSNIGRK